MDLTAPTTLNHQRSSSGATETDSHTTRSPTFAQMKPSSAYQSMQPAHSQKLPDNGPGIYNIFLGSMDSSCNPLLVITLDRLSREIQELSHRVDAIYQERRSPSSAGRVLKVSHHERSGQMSLADLYEKDLYDQSHHGERAVEEEVTKLRSQLIQEQRRASTAEQQVNHYKQFEIQVQSLQQRLQQAEEEREEQKRKANHAQMQLNIIQKRQQEEFQQTQLMFSQLDARLQH